MSRTIVPPIALEYPSGDGKPMAENDAQLAAILYGIGALRVHYESRENVYVSGDLLMYYQEGNPRVSVAPDVFVVLGVEDRVRMRYLVWEEGKGPDFVLEVASKSTWREDLGPKREIYARLGVKEYWMYDPTGEYFSPVLQGLRLAGGAYVRRLAVASPDGALTLTSETLGLELRAQGGELRFRDPATGRLFSATPRRMLRGGRLMLRDGKKAPHGGERNPEPKPRLLAPNGRLPPAGRRLLPAGQRKQRWRSWRHSSANRIREGAGRAFGAVALR